MIVTAFFFYFFQVEREKSIKIGKSSSLPANISKESIHLLKPLKIPKFDVGPTSARPGPILLRQEATEVNPVTKSQPLRAIIPIMDKTKIHR